MKSPRLSGKRIAIDKANATLMLAIGIATFITVFALVASKSLISQGRYQSKVISQKEKALNQLKTNIGSVETLNNSYQEFANKPENILGGDPKGTGDRDGDNPRVILDALPSKYDFPALATSIEKMLKDNNFAVSNFTGIDDEITQAGNLSESNPQPIEIPFTFEASVSPNSGKSLVSLLERSIRPIQVQKLSITGQNNELSVDVTAKTYFQPEKNLDVRKEAVR